MSTSSLLDLVVFDVHFQALDAAGGRVGPAGASLLSGKATDSGSICQPHVFLLPASAPRDCDGSSKQGGANEEALQARCERWKSVIMD